MKKDNVFHNKELRAIKGLAINKNCVESFRMWLVINEIKNKEGFKPTWYGLVKELQYSLEAWLKAEKEGLKER